MPAVSQNPQQDLAFLIGDLLGAQTSINQDSQTNDLSIKWQLANGQQILQVAGRTLCYLCAVS